MKWTRREVESMLEQVTSTDVPDPRPEFIAGLETRFGGPVRTVEPVVHLAPRPGIPRLAYAAVAAAAVIGLVVVTVDQRPSQEVRFVTPAGAPTTSPPTTTASSTTTLVPDPPFIVPGPTTSTTATTIKSQLATTTTRAKGDTTASSTPPTSRPEKPSTSTTRPKPTEPPRSSTTQPAEMRLACHPAADGSRPGIVCEWSSGPDGTAGFKLYREGAGEPRKPVFAMKDPSARRFFDGNVAPGSTYAYIVEAVTGDGRVLARGGPSRATCC